MSKIGKNLYEIELNSVCSVLEHQGKFLLRGKRIFLPTSKSIPLTKSGMKKKSPPYYRRLTGLSLPMTQGF